jgi:hypothetical protein
MRYTCIFLSVAMMATAFGQTQTSSTSAAAPAAPAAAPAEEAPAAPATAFTYKGFSASGYVDTYYNQNQNNPSSRYSQVQALNITANKLSLNSVTGSFAYDPAPVGFKLDIGYGTTYDSFFLSEPKHTDWSRYLLNAYVTVKPKSWKGLQLDFGKFVTSAGAEVTESHLNWNYSRSLLFAYGPYYHVGLRATMPVTSSWTVGGQVVTGWNVMRDNNTGKTFGFTSLNTFKMGAWSNVYYTGPENTGTNEGWRNFYDTALTLTPHERLSMYLNVDIGKNKSVNGTASFWGVGSAAKVTLNKYLSISPRFEYYADQDGFWTGLPQSFTDFTLTGELKLNESLITRLEYRKDWSTQPFFQVGQTPYASKRQTMIVAGLMFVVKPGMLKFGK